MAALAAFDATDVVVAFAASAVADVSSAVAAAFKVAFAVVAALVAALADALAAATPMVAVDGPPFPPRIEDRSSLAKLELMVEK